MSTHPGPTPPLDVDPAVVIVRELLDWTILAERPPYDTDMLARRIVDNLGPRNTPDEVDVDRAHEENRRLRGQHEIEISKLRREHADQLARAARLLDQEWQRRLHLESAYSRLWREVASDVCS